MREFASWLAQTGPSVFITQNLWIIPLVQSVHIVFVGIVFGSALLVLARLAGLFERDRAVAESLARYLPWFWGGLLVLAISGLLLIVGEPARELLSTSFWVKVAVIALASLAMLALQRRHAGPEAAPAPPRGGLLLLLAAWIAVIFLGRFIAWDGEIWGPLSPQFLG